MDPVKYRAVIKFLYLKCRTPKETFNERKEVYGDDFPSYYVVKNWHRQLMFTPFQKQERVKFSQALLTMCHGNQEDFFNRLITQDESWDHHYDPETKVQSMQMKHHDLPKKARAQTSAGKVILTAFWNQHGVILMDFLAKGTMITGAYYAPLLRKLWEAIKIKRQGMLTKCVILGAITFLFFHRWSWVHIYLLFCFSACVIPLFFWRYDEKA